VKSETQLARRGARKGRRALWLVPLIAVLGVAGYLGLGLIQQRAQATEPEPGQIVEAIVGDLSAKTTASGRLLPRREAALALSAAGRVEEVMAQVGDEVKKGDILIQLETGALERAVRSAEQNLAIQQANLAELHRGPAEEDVAAAEAAVSSAQAQLDQLLVGPRDQEVAASEANLRAAQASLWGAAEQRDQIAAGPSVAEIANAEAQVVQADMQQSAAEQAHSATMRCFTDPTGKEVCPGLGASEEQARCNLEAANKTLESAQAALDMLLAGADPNQLGAANASVSAAMAQRDAVQAQLDLLYIGPTEAQGASARAQLAQAEASLATLLAGASDERLAIAEAQVEQARIALENALDAVDNASLAAPFDGVVTAVTLTAGEYAAGRQSSCWTAAACKWCWM
jgi:HlyD family secretion protein